MKAEKTKIDKLVEDYLTDPNCWPELWIAGEKYLTSEEKEEFMKRVKQVNRHWPLRFNSTTHAIQTGQL